MNVLKRDKIHGRFFVLCCDCGKKFRAKQYLLVVTVRRHDFIARCKSWIIKEFYLCCPISFI
jgi:hypothetical protein